MPSVTTKIATESARPSLTQNIELLYQNLKAGGAFDAKTLVTDGKHNEMMANQQEWTHTVKGFKTKMQEQMSEMKMALDNTVVTTRMRTSVYGDLSTVRYAN